MKKWLLSLVFCLCGFLSATPLQDHSLDRAALAQLASALSIPADADLLAETQSRWLRKPDQERWEMTELPSEQKAIVLNWAAEQGLFAAWFPSSDSYDKALILGASTPRMQTRIDYLKQLWQEGLRFGEIVWLTGERHLDPRVDHLTDRCATESEAAHTLWEEADLPDEMRHLPVLFIAVPMKKEGLSLKRPNTEDTIFAWLHTDPQPCKALFIADQPFCGYQFAVIKSVLPEAFLFDLAGRGVDPTGHPAAAAVTLDSIARWIYQDRK